MRLIHRYALAAAVTAIACSGASAQVRDDRYPAVTGTIPPAAAARAGLERRIGLVRRSAHDRAKRSARRRPISRAACSACGRWPPGAACRATSMPPIPRALTPDLRIMDLLDCAAGIHQIGLGLSRPVGQRRAHRPRPRAARTIPRDLRCGGARLWRRPLYHRRDLGRGNQLRHARRRPAGDPLDRDARLHRPPAELFPRRISLGAGNSPARRRQARPPRRLLGRRLRPDPVHADRVQALRGRFRPRRPPRRGRLDSRHHRLDRQQPEEGRLGHRADLGLRSGGAGDLQFHARRPRALDADPRLGARSASRAPATSRSRGRTTAPSCWCRPACKGPAS